MIVEIALSGPCPKAHRGGCGRRRIRGKGQNSAETVERNVIDNCRERIQLIEIDDLITHRLLEEIQAKEEHAQELLRPLSEQ